MNNAHSLLSSIEEFEPIIRKTGRYLWENPEIARTEYRGAAYLADLYEQNGFTVERGVGGFPTCYLAIFRNGTDGPTIGLFSDFDALPELAPDRSSRPGHACMHNLYTATTVGTALLLRKTMLADGINGTIIVFGAPAEENGGAKQYLARQGFYRGVDAFFGVHPVPEENGVMFRKHLGILSKQYRFHGKSAHVFDTDFRGYNAVLAAQYFTIGLEFFKGQKNTDAKINAIISNGGKVTNRINDTAEVQCGFRGEDMLSIQQDEAQVDLIADCAAKALQCSVEIIEMGRYFNSVPSFTLAKRAQQNAETVGTPVYTAEEQQEAYDKGYPKGFRTEIKPLPEEPVLIMGGTDEGDASWLAPWLRIALASCPQEVGAHSFDFAEYANKDYVYKGIFRTAVVAAMTSLDVLIEPAFLAAAKAESAERQKRFPYVPSDQKLPPAFLFPQTPGVSVSSAGVQVDLDQCPLFGRLSAVRFAIVDGDTVLGAYDLDTERRFTIPLAQISEKGMIARVVFYAPEALTGENDYPYTYSYAFLN